MTSSAAGSKANHEAGLADRRGVICEVRLERLRAGRPPGAPPGSPAGAASKPIRPAGLAWSPDLTALRAVRLGSRRTNSSCRAKSAWALDGVPHARRAAAAAHPPEGVHLIGARLRLVRPPLSRRRRAGLPPDAQASEDRRDWTTSARPIVSRPPSSSETVSWPASNKCADNVPGVLRRQAVHLCHLCSDIAPAFFKESADGDHDYVHNQPASPEELKLCTEAMEQCPVEAIGKDGAG
jgi:ferredoxin